MRSEVPAVLDLIDREIWIVTAAADGQFGGLVATWVSAASIDPQQPTMLIGLAPNHFTAELVEASGAFALHLLGPSAIELVWRFAIFSGRDTNKFDGLGYRLGTSGSPILTDCLAWLDCQVVASHDAGDRLFFWGDPVAGRRHAGGPVLHEKQVLAAATPEQRAALLASRSADIKVLAPLRNAWRERASEPRG